MPDELQDDQIRLVSILPGDSDDNSLHVSRRHQYTFPNAASSQPPQSTYIALSYTWGQDRTQLKCDDQELEVSSHLVPALQQLKKHYPNKLFWTDSISIDQEHPGEKAHQVSMMGRIFATAEVVAVWFGNDTEDIHQTLNNPALDIRDNDSASEARIRLMRRLANIPWFYRAWTFQEIRLAHNAVIMLGTKLMPWTDFVRRIQTLRAFEPNLSTVELRSQPRSYSQFTYEPKDQFFTSLEELNTGVSTDLASLLFATWYREASVKHDKVYSLLSSALFEGREHGIGIDYDIAWSELCIKTARACISTSSDLKVLKIAGMKQRWKSAVTNRWDFNEFNLLLGHPSWAPNWWEPPQQLRSSASFGYDERGVFSALNFCCPKLPPPQSIDDISPFLSLKGVVLGILNVSDPPSYPNGPTLVHALPQCALGYSGEWLERPDRTPSASSLQGVCKVHMSAFIEVVQQHLFSNCFCVPFHERKDRHSHHIQTHVPTAWEKVNLKFNDNYFNLSHKQAINKTGSEEPNEASFPAQVLATSVESGDWLVLLEGGGMPFILRPVIDHMGQGRRPETMMTPEEQSRLDVPDGAGCFVLVGEASMCWDQLWPDMWDLYCRAGDFVII